MGDVPQKNLERTFGGVLRHFRLAGEELHEDDDRRALTVLTDDERPLVFYGEGENGEKKPSDHHEPGKQPRANSLSRSNTPTCSAQCG